MKTNNGIRLLLNTIWFTGIVCALYWLYAAQNHHPNNKPGSASQFVYQQF